MSFVSARGLLRQDLENLKQSEYLTTPDADEGMISINALRLRLDVAKPAILKAAERQGVTKRKYKFGGVVTDGFTQEESNRIWQDEAMATPNAEIYGAISMNQAKERLKITRGQLMKFIASLEIQLGEFRFGPSYTSGILPADLELIRSSL